MEYDRFVVSANTTSPTKQQVRGIFRLADEDIAHVHSVEFFEDMPCPTDIFLEIHHTTGLRLQAVEGQVNTDFLQRAANVFDALGKSDTNRWQRDNGSIVDARSAHIIGRTYQIAAQLYAILTLPRAATLSWARSLGPGQNCNIAEELRDAWRSELFKQIQQSKSVLESIHALFWPLIVLGVAAALGSEDERNIVRQGLFQIWTSQASYHGPMSCLNKLETFWSSGKTEWEDCFHEPTMCMP